MVSGSLVVDTSQPFSSKKHSIALSPVFTPTKHIKRYSKDDTHFIDYNEYYLTRTNASDNYENLQSSCPHSPIDSNVIHHSTVFNNFLSNLKDNLDTIQKRRHCDQRTLARASFSSQSTSYQGIHRNLSIHSSSSVSSGYASSISSDVSKLLNDLDNCLIKIQNSDDSHDSDYCNEQSSLETDFKHSPIKSLSTKKSINSGSATLTTDSKNNNLSGWLSQHYTTSTAFFPVKTWKKRFFVLKDDLLMRFKSEEPTEDCLESFPITSETIVCVTDAFTGKPWALEISGPNHKSWYLHPDSQEDLKAWLKALKAVVVRAKFMKRPLPSLPGEEPAPLSPIHESPSLSYDEQTSSTTKLNQIDTTNIESSGDIDADQSPTTPTFKSRKIKMPSFRLTRTSSSSISPSNSPPLAPRKIHSLTLNSSFPIPIPVNSQSVSPRSSQTKRLINNTTRSNPGKLSLS